MRLGASRTKVRDSASPVAFRLPVLQLEKVPPRCQSRADEPRFGEEAVLVARAVAAASAHQELHAGRGVGDEGFDVVVDGVAFGGVIDEEEHFHPLLSVCH